MISRFFRLVPAAVLSLVLVAPLSAQPAAPATSLAIAATDNDPVGPFNMPDVTLDAVLDLVEMLTGRTILRPAALPAGSYYFVRRTNLPKSEALLALETLLNLNQIALVPVGDTFIKVVPAGSLRAEAPELITGSTLALPPSGRAVSKIFTLQFLRVNEFLPEIAPLLNPQFGGPTLFAKANAALITDSITTLQRIELLLQELDRPATAGLTPKFYPLSFARASDLVTKINSALGATLRAQLGTATTYSADDRTNQVVLIADPSLHDWFGDLIAKLDVKADPNTRIEVIPLKHSIAILVAPTITQLVTGQTQAAASTDSVRPGEGITGAQQGVGGRGGQQGGQLAQGQAQGPGAAPTPAAPVEAPAITFSGSGDAGSPASQFSSLITILPEERSNSLIVSGTVDDIRLIRELVEKIDIVLAQVRIEAVIAEVTLGDNHSTGIEALGLQVVGDKLVGFSASMPGISVGDGTDGGFAALTRPGDAGFISGTHDLASIIRLTTTPRKDISNILSAPNILTAHNKEGVIFVGERRPVISGFVTDANTTTGARTNVTPQQIGIRLTVTPLIGVDGSIELTINLSIEDILGEILIDGNPQPRVGERNAESVVSLRSGEITVLGGLQRVSQGRSTSRLGPIPFIGDLLGKRTRNNTRTDLLFFLRPVVLTNTPADNVSALERVDAMSIKDDINRLLGTEAQ